MNDSGLMAASVAQHSGLHWGVVAVFAVVYLGMFLGGLPRLQLDSAGVARPSAPACVPGWRAGQRQRVVIRKPDIIRPKPTPRFHRPSCGTGYSLTPEM